ncbi:IspD/TarI family cytidylyltransferase [Leuconostoc mesenteroides]|uniref:IspD/TarI family cytidylyltransferase n=1 Tax=Leuconostoc mesenteroides TaxID=1245 RepID=UPI00385D4417
MLYAQVMAGGLGKRMGNTERPKQFLEVADKPIVIHTIEKFTLSSEFEAIIVSTHPQWLQYMQDIVSRYISDSRVHVIDGGQERNDTVINAINFIESKFGIGQDDVLVMHDAVRPFVTRQIIKNNIDASRKYKAVDTVIGATDTIVKAEDGKISEIPVRSLMYQGQTPQTVNISEFKKIFVGLSEDQKNILSDSAKVMLLGGHEVGIVDGAVGNFKITTPYDLKIAEIIAQENIDVQ